MIEALFTFLAGYYPPFNAILASPIIFERVRIFVLTGVVFGPFFLFFTLARKKLRWKVERIQAHSLLAILVVLMFALRASIGYNYDTPIAILVICTDLFVILIGSILIVRSFTTACHMRSGEDLTLSQRATLGLSILTMLSTIIVAFGWNRFFAYHAFIFIHGVISGLIAYKLLARRDSYLLNIDILPYVVPKIWWLGLLLPFLPYLFIASATDADVTTIAEITGFLLQGKDFSNVDLGLPGHSISIRYPLGFPALTWLLSVLLNIRAAESILLMWFCAWFVFLTGIFRLGGLVKIPLWILALLSMNEALWGWGGIRGGQIQEMLSYGFAVHGLCFLLARKVFFSAILISAGIISQPFSVLAVLPAYAWIGRWIIFDNSFRSKAALLGPLLCATCLLYLSTAGADLPSVPSEILADVTWASFFRNAWRFIDGGYFNFLYIGLFFIPRPYLGMIVAWFVSSFVVDGFFGEAQSKYQLRFCASFNGIGCWLICAGAFLSAAIQSISRYNYAPQLRIFFIGILLFFNAPIKQQFTDLSTAFVSHSDIRLGRMIEDLPLDSPVFNMRPPGDWGQTYSFVRGISGQNTYQMRMSGHQIKRGTLISSPGVACLSSSDIEGFWECINKLGIEWVWLSARPASRLFISGSPPYTEIIAQSGDSFFIKVHQPNTTNAN